MTFAELVLERGRTTKRPNLVAELEGEGIWNDLGALKRWLMDDLTRERNAFAKSVMTELEGEYDGKK